MDKETLRQTERLEQELEVLFKLYPYSCLEFEQSLDKSKVNHNHVRQDKLSLSHDKLNIKTKKRI